MDGTTKRRAPRRRAVGLTLLASAAAATSFGAATIVSAHHDDHGGLAAHEPRLLGERATVARGTSAEFGRWELLAADSDRGACLALRLVESGGGGEPADVYEGCGIADGLHTASLTGSRETLVYGRAPGADSVVVEAGARAARGGRRARSARVGRDGYFAASVPRSSRIAVVAHAEGRAIGRADVPVPGGR
jgi:hypothetical protein